MAHEHECPICASSAMQAFVEFADVPISGVFCRTPEDMVPQRDLQFDYCPRCAFVSQRPGGSAIDYSGVARPTARQLPRYARVLIDRLVGAGTDGLLVEVGCNDGTFLDELQGAGFKRLLGIEPSKDLAQHARKHGHAVVQEPLDQARAEAIVREHGPAAVVVCRHTVEHVPQPMAFLAALRTLLESGGLACIEVPSLRPVIEDLHVHELWDEHISYFLPETFSHALGAAGFAVEAIEVEPYREMENIVAWVRTGGSAVPMPDMREAVKLCASFNGRWRRAKDKLIAAVERSPHPLVAMGASHPQSNFLNFSGLASRIDRVIDDDPGKAGLWLPLQGGHVPIQPSARLRDAVDGGTLLLTGFGYPEWMAAARANVGDACTVMDLSVPLTQLAEATS